MRLSLKIWAFHFPKGVGKLFLASLKFTWGEGGLEKNESNNSVAFIGYPVQWDKTLMLHLVFATRANVSSKLTDQLSKLSQKAALMLLQEAEIMRDLSFDSVREDTIFCSSSFDAQNTWRLYAPCFCFRLK